MKSIHDQLRQRLHDKAGIFDRPERKELNKLYKTEWSNKFEQLMRNRLVMGSIRYEPFSDKRNKKAQYNYIRECIRRLEAYEKTGNKEFLVDAANMCLLEFEFPFKKKTYFDNEEQHNIHAIPIK